ncbi:MAG: RNA-binding domain-containing protein [Bacteroidota bacterium]
MDLYELRKLVSQGEGQHLEFKRKVNFPKKILREMIAFANTSGGCLLIGVNDDLNLSGVKYPDEEIYVLNEVLEKNCKPHFEYEIETIQIASNKYIIKYNIPVSEDRPHYLIESFKPFRRYPYVRLGDQSIKASREIAEIIRRGAEDLDVQFSYGEHEKILFQYLEDHHKITLERFQTLTNLPKKDASSKLINLVLAKVLQILPDGKEDYYLFKNNLPDTSHSYFYPLI